MARARRAGGSGRGRSRRRPRRPRSRGAVGWGSRVSFLRYLVGTAVAGDVLAQRLQGVDPDARQTRELQLDLERRRVLLRGGDEPVGHGAQLPAARIVLDAY